MEPATSAWLRYVFAVVVFFVGGQYPTKTRGGQIGFSLRHGGPGNSTIWMGLLGTMGYQLLFMNGMKWTAAGDASLIIPLNPVFTVLLALSHAGSEVTKKMAWPNCWFSELFLL